MNKTAEIISEENTTSYPDLDSFLDSKEFMFIFLESLPYNLDYEVYKKSLIRMLDGKMTHKDSEIICSELFLNHKFLLSFEESVKEKIYIGDEAVKIKAIEIALYRKSVSNLTKSVHENYLKMK